MFKKDIGFLFAILKMCDDIELYKANYEVAARLIEDRMGLNACLMNISQIGEFTGRLSEEFKKQFDQVEWNKIKGLRNIIIHDYFGIDTEKVEEVITINIPGLINKLKEIVHHLEKKKIIEQELLVISAKDFKKIKL